MLHRVRTKFSRPPTSASEELAAVPASNTTYSSTGPESQRDLLASASEELAAVPASSTKYSGSGPENQRDLLALRASASPDVRDCAMRLQHALDACARADKCSEKIHHALRPYAQADGLLPKKLAEQATALAACVAEQTTDMALDVTALPDALICEVMGHLSAKDLVVLGATSKSLRQAGRDDRFWTYQTVARLSPLALACLPKDIKQKAEVQVTMWIQDIDAMAVHPLLVHPRDIYKCPRSRRVLGEPFAEEALLSAASRAALASAYDRLAKAYLVSEDYNAVQSFKPSPALRQAMLRWLRSNERLRYYARFYATAEDVVEITQRRLAAQACAHILTDDREAIRLLREKMREGPDGMTEPLHEAIHVSWLKPNAEIVTLRSPFLRLPDDF